MGLFSRKKRPAPTDAPEVILLVHLAARVQPKHRGSVYEDPLDELLARHAPGSEVVGGGTAFTPETGPTSCDIEVKLVGDPAKTAALVIDILEHLGAPVGSSARLGDLAPMPFGQTHGFALVLDGVGLPDDVYVQHDINDLIGLLQQRLGEEVELQSWWEGPENTALYFYGRDPELITSVLGEAATLSPLARGSRVEAIT